MPEIEWDVDEKFRCACVFSASGHRCPHRADGEDGICRYCRAADHQEEYPDARHAWTGQPLCG